MEIVRRIHIHQPLETRNKITDIPFAAHYNKLFEDHDNNTSLKQVTESRSIPPVGFVTQYRTLKNGRNELVLMAVVAD